MQGGDRKHLPLRITALLKVSPGLSSLAARVPAVNVCLSGAVVFEVSAVSRMDIRQVDSAVGFLCLPQALKDVLPRRALGKKLLMDRFSTTGINKTTSLKQTFRGT